MRRRFSTAPAVIGFVLLLLGTVPVMAEKDRKGPDPSTKISPSGSQGEVGKAASSQPISSCGGYSDNPHRSRRVPGTMDAKGRSKCPGPYPTIYVSAELYRDNNFVVRENEYANNRSRDQATAAPADDCSGSRPTLFELKSYHYVLFPDGRSGSARTGNRNYVNC